MTWLLVAVGGALGAAARYLVDLAATRRFGTGLPWGTLLVNVTGSAALGLLVGLSGGNASSRLVALLGTGFCGAFTTASAVAWETLALAEHGPLRRAAAYLAVSLALGVALAGAGLAAGLALNS